MSGNVIPFAPRRGCQCQICGDLGQIGDEVSGVRYCRCPLGQEMKQDAIPMDELQRIKLKIFAAIIAERDDPSAS